MSWKRTRSWLASWFGTARVGQQLGEFNRRLDRLEQRRSASLAQLERRAAALAALADRAARDADDARRLHRQYEAALSELREKNQVLEQTINILVASHKLIMERYDAEAAVEVRRRVTAGVRE